MRVPARAPKSWRSLSVCLRLSASQRHLVSVQTPYIAFCATDNTIVHTCKSQAHTLYSCQDCQVNMASEFLRSNKHNSRSCYWEPDAEEFECLSWKHCWNGSAYHTYQAFPSDTPKKNLGRDRCKRWTMRGLEKKAFFPFFSRKVCCQCRERSQNTTLTQMPDSGGPTSGDCLKR